MAYTALYRKWRPARFEDVRGQDHIVRTLKNQIISDRVGHAYLFCGTRGTGKTTVAKIMARAVNCEHPVDGSPCNECAVCKAILEGRSVNVAEIDAASNNGVDNIREIRDQVQYSPTEGKYRVYIIDEVHMLSPGAFNALLKTLEEPPAYVIFILATTEANRIPITVLSRCQRYDFHRIGNGVIADQISHLLAEENVEADEDAVRYVAKAADGSMRDALSLLEQCISFYYGQRLTYEKVLDVLGAVDTQVFSRLLRLIIECNVAGCVKLMDEISAQGRDFGQFVNDFIWYQRNLMMVQTADQSAQALDMTAENYEALREESKMVALPVLMRNIRICSELSNQLKFAVSKRVLIEVAIIKMMQPQMEEDLDSIRVRLDRIEEQLSSGSFVQAAQQTVSDAAGLQSQSEVETIELSEAEYDDYQKLKADWDKIREMQYATVKSILKGTYISYEKEKGPCIIFTDKHKHDLINEQNHMEEVRQVINDYYQKEFSINPVLREKGKAMPRVIRSNHIDGINMEIGDEEGKSANSDKNLQKNPAVNESSSK